VVRAINALLSGKRDGFEFEVSDAITQQTGRQTTGVLVPTSISAALPGGGQRSQLSVGGAAKGAETKFTEYAGFIDMLRSRLAVAAMGANFVGGVQGDLGFVNQTAAGTATWGNETANAALSSLSTGLRTAAPKTLQSATSYTRQLLRQSVVDVENLVRSDIAAVHARAIDLAAIAGTGASNQPRGILNTVGIGAVVGGTNGAQPTYENLVALQREVAVDNALMGSLGYLAHPLVAARLMLTQKFAGTSGDPVWTGSMLEGQAAGFKAMASTQVPSAQTKGTSTDCSPVIYGDWSSLYVFEWGAMELLVDQVTLGPALIKVMSIQFVDVFLRYIEAFAAMADARA
jgi:HK97 family phage major capsid protein